MSKQISHQKPLKREIELDFVRGVAILMVIDFHSPMGILFYPFRLMGFKHFGWAGVDVFFVLSGFLVGGLLVKEWKVRGRIDSKRFLIRRGFKIWPQYYFFILLMLRQAIARSSNCGATCSISRTMWEASLTPGASGSRNTRTYCWSCALQLLLDKQRE